jgi:hypothetical protein
VSSDYYGSIAGAERAWLDWLNEYARREPSPELADDFRAAFDAGRRSVRDSAHTGQKGGGSCCEFHGRRCEATPELCCEDCTEVRHSGWTDDRGVERYGHPSGEVCAGAVLPCEQCPNAATCAASDRCLEPRRAIRP